MLGEQAIAVQLLEPDRLWPYVKTIAAITAATIGVSMSDKMNRFLGDTPGRVLLKLILVSLFVGVIMNAFNWSPLDILYGFENFARRIWNLGFGAIERFAGYFLLGAVVVVPCFIILRLLSYRR